jgi:hypothetical protein
VLPLHFSATADLSQTLIQLPEMTLLLGEPLSGTGLLAFTTNLVFNKDSLELLLELSMVA